MPLIGPRLHRWLHGELPAWYHPDYRLPVPALEHLARRAGMAAEWLLDARILGELRQPERISLEQVARVHAEAWVDALTRPEALTSVFGMQVPVDSVLDTIRAAAGGTVAAAEVARKERCATLNLMGGFHHAHPARGHGFSPINDIAIAALDVPGRIGVIDLDAHPPDGTAACLPDAWIGSISGTAWDPLPNVDNTIIFDADDERYLLALDRLLGRLPDCSLWFVVAGGDVLEGDPLGHMHLTLEGIRQRDQRVLAALHGQASVWLPAGGYTDRAWRVLAGTACVLAGMPDHPIAPDYDPLQVRFSRIYHSTLDTELSAADIDASLRLGNGLLGWYTANGVELAFERYGILRELRRLGYSNFQVKIDANDTGDRMRLYAGKDMLVENVLARSSVDGRPVLWVHWLTLRHPRGAFTHDRPRLPGQDTPGLGLAREAIELLALVARRLGLEGVAMRPAQLHVAWIMWTRMHFAEPLVQARMLALRRDLGHLPLTDLTKACAEGRIRRNGEVWMWEAETMVGWADHVDPPVEAAPDVFSLG